MCKSKVQVVVSLGIYEVLDMILFNYQTNRTQSFDLFRLSLTTEQFDGSKGFMGSLGFVVC